MRFFGIYFVPKAERVAAHQEVEEAQERLLKASEDLRRAVADVLTRNEKLRGDRVQDTRR